MAIKCTDAEDLTIDRVFPVFLAAQRDGHGLHTATARTPSEQGFTIGANQCRLLRLVGWGGFGVGWGIGWATG